MSNEEYLYEEFHYFINSDLYYQMVDEMEYPTR